MTIQIPNDFTPRRFQGIPATLPAGFMDPYQEKFITRANPNIPVEVTGQVVTRTRTGVSQVGLQQYTEP